MGRSTLSALVAAASLVMADGVSAAGPEELRMGVKFIDPSPEARAQIDAFLARAGV